MTTYDCADPDARLGRTGRGRRAPCAPGKLVVLPTDTVYGIGADAFNAAAVPDAAGGEGPRAGHAGAGAGRLVDARSTGWSRRCRRSRATLVEAFWPGGLSLVLSSTRRR